MKDSKILPDDPQLTAYALGELDGEERAAIEAALINNPDAQAAVAQIRALAGELEGAFASEPLPKMDAPANKAAPAVSTAAPDGYRKKRKVISFPQFYFIAGGLAAACFAVMVALHEPAPKVMVVQKAPAPVLMMMPALEDAVSSTGKQTPVDSSRAASRASIEFKFAEEEFARSKNEQRLRGFASAKAAAIPYETAVLYAPASTAPASVANNEAYAFRADNNFLSAKENPLSTFSMASDTASYTNLRRLLMAGQKPPADAVRIEEMLNYFGYRYAAPKGDDAFAASLEVADAPWADGHRLVRVGLKGREVTTAQRGAANLVFLLDVSGSMNDAKKLPLVKASLRMLVSKLRPDDRVAIITYAGSSGMALASTPAKRASEIVAALDELEATGSTNGAMGIQLAYDVAKANFVEGGINRVILCTDGDFNVGVTSEGDLTRLIQDKAKSGVFLSVMGFGMGNYKDATLESLASKGNGNYGYIDTRAEAEKLFVEQINGTLVTIAKDVKIQVEFNPAQVARYRLIGYESRLLNKEDFNNDTVDAGEIGAGHSVTALYEVIPAGADDASGGPKVDDLKYQQPDKTKSESWSRGSPELLTVKLRYKEPQGDVSKKLEFPLVDRGERFAEASEDFKFAAAVAGFGMLLRDSPHKGNVTLAEITRWAHEGMQTGGGDYRSDFLKVLERAETVLE